MNMFLFASPTRKIELVMGNINHGGKMAMVGTGKIYY